MRILLATTKYITEIIQGKFAQKPKKSFAKHGKVWRIIPKLRYLKNSVVAWKCSDQRVRLNKVVLARLRIGHKLKTNQYLKELRTAPFCLECVVPMTVKHFIAESPSLIDSRTHGT